MGTEIETVYTPAELAQRWKVSAETVRAMCREGVLGSFPVGRQIRIPESAARAYQDAGLTTAST
jgi:excisionase family DNA binding protein